MKALYRDNKGYRVIFLALAASMLFLLLALGTGLVLRRAIGSTPIDYGKRPREMVFREILGKTIPRGISNLEITGRIHFVGQVKMSFNATESAIRELIPGFRPITAEQFLQKVTSLDPPEYNADWHKLLKSHNLDFYAFDTFHKTRSLNWTGAIAVDKEHGKIYVYAAPL